MKALLFLLSICLVIMTSHAQVGAPNPPSSVCYNYDKAGNRISQTPEWISLDPNVASILCTPNNPEFHWKPRRIFLVEFSEEDFRIRYTPFDSRVWVMTDKKPAYAMAREVPPLVSSGAMQVKVTDPILDDLTPQDVVYYTADFLKNTGGKLEDPSELSIVPNPNIGKFRIIQKGFDVDWTQITIVDASGRVLFVRDFINGEVNVGEFAPGVYILVLKDRTHQSSVRFEKRM
jgi:hypothetical protein